MSRELNDEQKKSFSDLIKSLELRDIRFIDMHTHFFSDPTPGKELNYQWKQQFADEDPGQEEDNLFFRPRYEITITEEGKPVFTAVYITLIRFEIKDHSIYQKAWDDPEVQEIFQKQQILRTMWTVLRGHLMDAMHRHSINAPPLPWLYS